MAKSCCALLLAVSAWAWQRPSAQLEGRVVDSVTGEPIPHASVTLIGARTIGAQERAATQLVMRPVTVNDQGNFSDTVSPGTYRAVAARNGYVSMPGPSQSVTLAADEKGAIVIKLVPQAGIAGKITGVDGKPMAKVFVEALRWRLHDNRRVLMPMVKTTTDDAGQYHFDNLTPADYVVMAQIAAPANPDVRVHNATGQAYAATYYPGVTDPAAAQSLPAMPGVTRDATDLRLLKVPVVRITGKIIGAIETEDSPNIALIPNNSLVQYDGVTHYAHVDGKHNFELPNVPAGSYLLYANYFRAHEAHSARMTLDVGTRDITGLNVAISDTPTLIGRIRGEDVDFDKILVTLSPRMPNPLGPTIEHATFLGSMGIKHVFPDTYRVQVNSLPPDIYVEKIKLNGIEVSDLLDLKNGIPGDLYLALQKGTAVINGRVAGKDEKPQSDALVVLFNTRNELVQNTRTDTLGNYELKEVAPGKYRLAAGYLDISDPDAVERLAAKATEISVGRSSRAQQTLALSVP
jgi:protocatechuate 3,4-dioxygenase beta subunit